MLLAACSNVEPLPAAAPPRIPAADMIAVPSGTAILGSDDPSRPVRERPAYSVSVSAFRIDRTEVTNQAFAAFVAATGHVTVPETPVREGRPPRGSRRSDGRVSLLAKGFDWAHPAGPQSDWQDAPDFPVLHVAWTDAAAFCAWRGARLPTEAEWAYVARSEPAKPRSDALVAATKATPSALGTLGMNDNVSEWVSDFYQETYWARQAAQGAAIEDPQGPAHGSQPGGGTVPNHVIRGASWACSTPCEQEAVSWRAGAGDVVTSDTLGFRCAAGPQNAEQD